MYFFSLEGNSFHNLGLLYLMDFWPFDAILAIIVVYMLAVSP